MADILTDNKNAKAALTEAQAKVEALEASNKEIQTKLADATRQIGDLQTGLDAANKKVDEATKRAEAAEGKLAGIEAEVEKRASAKALEIAASQGAQPVKTAPKPEPQNDNPESKLTGLAKVEAVFLKQISNHNKH